MGSGLDPEILSGLYKRRSKEAAPDTGYVQMANRNGNDDSNFVKKPTREDLRKAADAAVTLAETFMAAADNGIEETQARGRRLVQDTGLKREGHQGQAPGLPAYKVRGTRGWDAAGPKMGRASTRDKRDSQRGQVAADSTETHARRRRPEGTPAAFEEFMAQLQDAIAKGGNKLRVSETNGFVKIESLHNGHKIYIAKSKTSVSRAESTIQSDRIEGAQKPYRPNGRIASWLPADPEVISQAIGILVSDEEGIKSPKRGAGDTSVDRERSVDVQQSMDKSGGKRQGR